MFTGLIEVLGTVDELREEGAGSLLSIAAPEMAPHLEIGESVAINGVCLTVVSHNETTCQFQVGPETLVRSNLGRLRVGERVNLEQSLRVGDRLGGHFVQGHVDGVGSIAERIPEGDWETFWFSCPEELTLQMASKGSIAIDGVSLTLVDVEPMRCSVALIPHTLAKTTLGFKQVGAEVNLETDMIAKHVLQAVKAFSEKS